MGEFSLGITIVVFIMLLMLIPIKIAESRGVKGQSLTKIKVLSCLGILLLVTCFIALITWKNWKS